MNTLVFALWALSGHYHVPSSGNCAELSHKQLISPRFLSLLYFWNLESWRLGLQDRPFILLSLLSIFFFISVGDSRGRLKKAAFDHWSPGCCRATLPSSVPRGCLVLLWHGPLSGISLPPLTSCGWPAVLSPFCFLQPLLWQRFSLVHRELRWFKTLRAAVHRESALPTQRFPQGQKFSVPPSPSPVAQGTLWG